MCDFDACLAGGTCGNLPVNSKYPQKTMSTNVILGNMLLTAQNVAGARWQCKCCHRRRCNYFYLLLLALLLLCGCCCFCGWLCTLYLFWPFPQPTQQGDNKCFSPALSLFGATKNACDFEGDLKAINRFCPLAAAATRPITRRFCIKFAWVGL